MSVSGRAGAGGGGPHHGPLPQRVEAMLVGGSARGCSKQIRASFGRPFFCCPRSPPAAPPPEELGGGSRERGALCSVLKMHRSLLPASFS